MAHNINNTLIEIRQLKRAEPATQEFHLESTQNSHLTEELITIFSHEFRTPLNGMLGMSEALLENVFGDVNEEQLNAIATINRSGLYLSALINNLLDISKIQTSKLELETTDISVTDLCYSSSTYITHHAIGKQIELSIQIQDDIDNIKVDLPRMHQVLVSILNRAIDRTPIGGKVTLAVTCHDVLDLYSPINFVITDTGEAFEDFQKDGLLGSSLTNKQSIGLGLILVNPIINLHGGSISFRRSVGQGNQISILLPNTCSHTYPSLDDGTELTFSSSSISDRVEKAPLILIVEDNELNIDMLFSYLAAKGYQPIVAQNGRLAVEMTKKYHPDLILMDIQMPEMDGLEAISRIRQQPEFQSIPIIALTALVMEGDQEKCLRAGANEYMSKPLQLRELHKMIQLFLVSPAENESPQSEFFFS